MNGPSPLDQAQRELIFAYAAGLAGCGYVAIAHAAVAYARGIEEGLIEDLLAGTGMDRVDAKIIPILAFTRKLMTEPDNLERIDHDAILDAGWDEDAIHHTIAICGRAAFMHRMVMGYGFIPFSREEATRRAHHRIEKGYVNLYPALAKPVRDHPSQG